MWYLQFHSSQKILQFLFWYLLWLIGYLKVCHLNFIIAVKIPNSFLFVISNFIPLWWEGMCSIMALLLNILIFVLWASIWFIWRRQWHPTPVLLLRKSHGRRSLEGCSPWGRWGSDTTERLHFHFSLSCIGEGNGNPLQCSCLENPRDGGSWWAAVYGIAQSRTTTEAT